jgi:thiamine pyrophosphate-dependent acetolactate synthase large subunit-like protein
MAMDQQLALEVLAGHRGSRIVIPTMGAVGFWQKLSDTALDFTYMPSSMGQGPALALGLALAQPHRGAIVLCGDGSLLMNLGCLVTIAQHTADLWLILLDNSQYEVTGGQPVAGAGQTDYAGLARASGISRAYAFDDIEKWRAGAAEALSGNGPVLVWLKLTPIAGQKTPTPAHPMAEQISRLRAALGVPD